MAPPSQNGASSHKTEYVAQVESILYLIIGLKVTPVFLNGWIWPIGGVPLGRISVQSAKQAYFHISRRPKTSECLEEGLLSIF